MCRRLSACMCTSLVAIATERCTGGGGSAVLPGREKGEEKELGQWEPAPGWSPKAFSRKCKKGRSLSCWRAYRWGRGVRSRGFGLREEVSQSWGLEEVLAGVRRERKARFVTAVAFGAVFFRSFQVCVARETRGRVLGELCGVRAKNLGEEGLCRARDE
ncbi:hypothetical protein MPNT_10411 [Candidatus Methylacidithermus pantelleriae]|uniref:Uncharacterized protein n=1 Tax=Candidatus Methylacidithermus pantelleriae TaxID=2744239 RepID=A0A8J2BIZ5_9BACT|nr:hypothetical protein MPNT_10411 [Candidatus Methylacidithermus pantelleriae]